MGTKAGKSRVQWKGFPSNSRRILAELINVRHGAVADGTGGSG